jgi:diguanylate cyclase (GGDEF)-like protein
VKDQEGKTTPEATSTRRHNDALRAFVESLGLLLAETSELDSLVRLVATSLTEAVGGTGCDLYVNRGGRLCCLASLERGEFCPDYVGKDLDLEEFPATATAVAGREILMVEDADDPRLTDAEREEFAEFGRRSELCVPLLIDEQVVGLLDIFSDRRGGFVGCLDFARSVGQLVAGAIANALLLEELEHSNRDLRTLVECGRDFGATLDPEDVLLSLAQTMKEASGATCCDLFELDGNDGIRGLASVDESGVDAELPGTSYPMEECLAVKIPLDSHERYAVPDAQTDTRLSSEERADLAAWGYRAVLVLPLRTRQQTLGVAMLYDRRAREFDHVEFLEGLAQVAAQALANASLHREVVRSAERLAVVTESSMEFSSTLAIEEVLASTVARLSEVIDVTGCYIYKLVGDELVCVAAVRRDAPTKWLGTALKLADWVSSQRAIETRGPVMIHSAADDGIGAVEREAMRRDGEKCGLVVPLIAKDYYTLGHAVRVSAYMALLGSELGWSPELRAQVEEAAYLHDIGKIGISDQVLLKPGRLNEREWELMRYHPIYGADTIGPLFDPELVRAVRAHHERYDGCGYPDGLGGDEIPEVARAMCVADSYDAMSLRRPYRRALTYTESVEELKRCRGAQFDPLMTDAFLRVLSRLEVRREKAIAAAREAARRIDVGKHSVLARPGDESRPEYGEIHEVLRDVRRRTIPDGVMMTFACREGRYVFVVDEDEQFGRAAQIGDEVFADQELPEAFAGVLPDMNALLVDQFGIWLGGRVPVMDENGEVVAVVGADLPPSDTGSGGLRSEVSTTLSQMFQSGSGRLKRTEFDTVSDGLTGLYTHRYLQERLGEELERARGSGSSVALLIGDIDGFHEFNERRGHGAGDRALHEIARVIENTGRRIDLPARYGGEEFGLVLLDASREGAVEVAERIRERVADTRVTPHGDRLTISIGVAVFPDDASDRDELIDKADWAMKLAKRQGRDRVATFTETVGSEQS